MGNLQKRQIFILIAAILFSGFHMYAFRRLWGGGLKFYIVSILILLSVVLITLEAGSDGFGKRMLGIGSGHRADLDILRNIAAIFVIVTHTVQADYTAEMAHVRLYAFIFLFTLCCNILYIMLSGALLLTYKEQKIGEFYLKQLPKVLIPMFVYFYGYLILHGETDILGIREILLRFLTGDTGECPHFWLMYVIVSLYLAYPFIRYMVKDMPFDKLSKLALLIVLFITLQRMLPVLGVIPAITTFWADWIGVAFLGYWITRPESRRYDKLVLAGGIAGTAWVIYIASFSDRATELIAGVSPITILLAMAIFVICIRLFEGRQSGVLLSICSKYSFGIILAHWGVLFLVTIPIFHMNIFFFHGIGLIISVVITFLWSLYVAFFVDQFILKSLLWVWNKVISGLVKS